MPITHGGSRTREYSSFVAMLSRCRSTDDKHYRDYGGRGIKVCKEWDHASKFPAFLSHVGRRPTSKHTIERINHNGNYEPGNVRWATMAQQMRNTRRTRFFTINGETLCITDWAAKHGLETGTLWGRLKRGWTIEEALNPIQLGVPKRLRHLTLGQRRKRKLNYIREWRRSNPKKLLQYSEESYRRYKEKRNVTPKGVALLKWCLELV